MLNIIRRAVTSTGINKMSDIHHGTPSPDFDLQTNGHSAVIMKGSGKAGNASFIKDDFPSSVFNLLILIACKNIQS
jgi:hypothetical protein